MLTNRKPVVAALMRLARNHPSLGSLAPVKVLVIIQTIVSVSSPHPLPGSSPLITEHIAGEQKRTSPLITEHIAEEQKRTYSWSGVCVWSGAWQIKSCGQLPDKLTITTVTLTRGPGRTVWRGIKNKSKQKHRAMSRDYNYPPRYHQLSPLITLNTLSAE